MQELCQSGKAGLRREVDMPDKGFGTLIGITMIICAEGALLDASAD